jgi:hypothetical protein
LENDLAVFDDIGVGPDLVDIVRSFRFPDDVGVIAFYRLLPYFEPYAGLGKFFK